MVMSSIEILSLYIYIYVYVYVYQVSVVVADDAIEKNHSLKEWYHYQLTQIYEVMR